MRTFQCLAVALVSAAVQAAVPTAAAQGPDTVFHETTEVVVVNVDVTVTDRQGRPVLGLGPDDFTVLEDGEPMAISNFAIVDERRRDVGLAPQGGSAAPDDGAVPAAPQTGGDGSEDGLDLFVYVDNFNLIDSHRNRVLDTLLEHLDRTRRPSDRVTLVVHQGGQISVLLRRSSSREEIAGAVESLRALPGSGLDDRILQRQTVRGIQDVFELYPDGDVCTEAEGVLLSVVTNYADTVSQQVRASIQGLEALVRVLSSVEGRKPVLMVSHGFPAQPGLGMFSYLEDLCGGGRFLTQASSYDETDRLEALASSANANRVTFFALQASGLAAPPQDFSLGTDMMMRQNAQHPMQVMAEETGGRTIFNTNRFDGPLQAVDTDARVYYSVGYRPGHEASGEARGDEHRIEVRLAGQAARELDGVTLRYRRRYSLKTIAERLAERTLGALHGFEDNPLGIKLAVGILAEGSRPRALLRIGLPRERLSYVPRDGRWEAAVDLVIGHVGEAGWETRQRRITLTAEGEDADPPEGIETIQVAVEARPGSNRFAVGVADVVSSRIATVAGSVEVPPEAAPVSR